MTQLSYYSDKQLKFVVRTVDGDLVDPNTTWLKIHLRCGGSTFYAVNDPFGDETKRCHIEDGVLVVDVASKKLQRGTVEYMIEVREDCQYFKDGYKNIFPLDYTLTEIEIV